MSAIAGQGVELPVKERLGCGGELSASCLSCRIALMVSHDAHSVISGESNEESTAISIDGCTSRG